MTHARKPDDALRPANYKLHSNHTRLDMNLSRTSTGKKKIKKE